mgnify:CR=1 FL=1
MRFPWNHLETENKMEYTVESYPDGSKYVDIIKFSSTLVFRLNSYEDLWLLNQIHDVAKHQGRIVSVIIPNLIDAQADRRFTHNQPNGLKLVCSFLNEMKNFFYKIYHPHNPEVVEALLDRVEIIDNSEFIDLVLAKGLMSEYTSETEIQWDKILESNLILMSSDAGGFKPLMKLCDKLGWQGETSSASKSRKYVNGKSELTQILDRDDFKGKDILIIDDICVYGGTFKGLAKMLKKRNCGRLFLAVSHMTVLELGKDTVGNYFDRVFTTNSKFEEDYTSDGNTNLAGVTKLNIF